MSLTSALSNALSGLNASSLEAELIANNVANAQTPGYTRRVAELTAERVGGSGSGVDVAAVRLVQDSAAVASRRRSDAELGQQTTQLVPLEAMGEVLGLPGDGNSLADAAAAFEISLSAAASEPASEPRLTDAVNKASTYADTISTLSTETQRLRMEADSEIGRQVEVVNSNLSSIEFLNREIKMITSAGGDASALMDERKALVDEVSSILPIRAVQREDGEIALFTANGAQLLDPSAVTIGYTPTPIITQDMTLGSGALSGLTIDGRDMSVGQADGSGLADGGSLGALFETRDTVLPGVADQLDALAEDLVNRFQDAGIDGTRALGDPGLFTDDGAAYDPLDLEGLAGRLTLNAVVDPVQGGEVWRLRDGLGAVTPGTAGDASLLEDLVGAATANLAPSSALGFTGSGGLADFAADLTSTVATRRLQAETTLSFTSATNQTLRADEVSSSGVNTDTELQRLLQVEQAYAANALVLETVDSLIQRLLEI